MLEAIEDLDVDAGQGFDHLEEELGDLLFQVVFHATLAAEEGQFTLADVARGIDRETWLATADEQVERVRRECTEPAARGAGNATTDVRAETGDSVGGRNAVKARTVVNPPPVMRVVGARARGPAT